MNDKEKFCEFLDRLVEGDCDCKYCFLKVFIASTNPKPFLLSQLKCIEKFKWEESERCGQDIGWTEAVIRWADRGYAAKLREHYNMYLPVNDLYKKVIS